MSYIPIRTSLRSTDFNTIAYDNVCFYILVSNQQTLLFTKKLMNAGEEP